MNSAFYHGRLHGSIYWWEICRVQARKRQSDFQNLRDPLETHHTNTASRFASRTSFVFCVGSLSFPRFNEGFEMNVHSNPHPNPCLVSYFSSFDLFSNCCMTSSHVATQNAFGLYLMCVGNQPIRDAGAKT